MIVEPNRKTWQRKNASAVALSAEISFKRRLWELPFVLFSVVKKNAKQSTVMRVNNKRKHAHSCAFARKRACRTRFLTCVCAKMVRAFCVCVGRLSLTCTVHTVGMYQRDMYIPEVCTCVCGRYIPDGVLLPVQI